MVNDLSKQGGRALSADLVQSLLNGITASRASTPIAGGKPLLRLLKSGVWVFGQQDEPVQGGSEWAVNPLSIRHGYVCWSNYPGNQKNELLGEVLVGVTEPKPMLPEPIFSNGMEFAYKEERVFDLKCVLGDDAGVEVLYKTNSVGGMRTVDNLLAAITNQIHNDPAHLVAIVQLNVDYYNNKYGQIFNPIIDVVDWADQEGNRVKQAAIAQQQPTQQATAPTKPKKAPIVKAPVQPAQRAEQAAAEPEAQVSPAPVTAMRPGAAPRRQRPENRA